jgi:hypothetical protein
MEEDRPLLPWEYQAMLLHDSSGKSEEETEGR